MKRYFRIGIFIAALTAIMSSGAFANVGPKAEGVIPSLFFPVLIVIGVFVIDPDAYKKPLSWIAATFLFCLSTSSTGFFTPMRIYPSFIYFIIKAVQLLTTEESRVSKAARISFIIAIFFFANFSIKFGQESSAYHFYNRGHQELSLKVAETAEKIEDYKNKSRYKLYPEEEIFITKIYPDPEMFESVERSKIEPATLKYEPSADRMSFVLCYSGGYFNKNPWYMLPSGYPLYRSGKGIEQGERIPYLNALMKKWGFSR